MRIVFAGTPITAVPTLNALHAAGHEIVLVLTRPDAPLGRKRILTPSPVASAAEKLGLPILKTVRPDAETSKKVAEAHPTIGVVVAYGAILSENMLTAPGRGWINLHFSSLPAWRGAAPVQRALIAGEKKLGITVFQLVSELDAGPVFATEKIVVDSGTPADTALGALAQKGAPLLCETLECIADGTARSIPQHGATSYAAKLNRADGQANFKLNPQSFLAHWAGVTPEPGMFCTHDGKPLKLLQIAVTKKTCSAKLAPGEARLTDKKVLLGLGTKNTLDATEYDEKTVSAAREQPDVRHDCIELLTVQPAGKQAMPAHAWLRGRGGKAQLQ